MRVFNYATLKDKKWDNEIIGYIAQIHEYKAKQQLFAKQKPQELEKLVEIARVQSTQASNEIEGIRTTSTRLKQLLSQQTTPRNRAEEEIAGYRDALNIIHENYEYIPITANYILQLHKTLYSHSSKDIGGKYKNVQNYITATDMQGNNYTLFTPLAPFETATAIDNICDEFNRAMSEGQVDPLILIPIFIHDFLCIHPFLDGNGRISRLLTTLLLYRCGYLVGKYISLEAKINKNKDLYYDALVSAQQDWHNGADNPEAFIKYLLGTIIAAYRDFEQRIDIISDNATAIDIVKKTIDTILGKFNKAKIIELCPTLGIKSIESALKKLCDSVFIQKHGTGKNTSYTKTNKVQ